MTTVETLQEARELLHGYDMDRSGNNEKIRQWKVLQQSDKAKDELIEELLSHTVMLEKTLQYYIKKSELEGDIEGANLKDFTKQMVSETIENAKKLGYKP